MTVEEETQISDAEALYDVLAGELGEMPVAEQLQLLTALQDSTEWSALPPAMRARFEHVAQAFLG